MKSDFKYKRPPGKLYRVPTSRWSKFYGKRARYAVTEVYIDGDNVTVHHLPSKLLRLFVLVTYPAWLVGVTLAGGVREAVSDLADVLAPKKRNSFSVDSLCIADPKERNKLLVMVGELPDDGTFWRENE